MVIKKLLILVLSLSIISEIDAQTRYWEVGWQIFNDRPVPGGILFSNAPPPALVNGIVIKHRNADFKKRFSFQYLNLEDDPRGEFCCDRLLNEGKYKGVELSAGIQKSALWGPLEYYFLFDVGLGMGQFEGQADGGFVSGFRERYNLRYRAIGAYPGLGANIWIYGQLAINWELRWSGVFYKTRGTYESRVLDVRAPSEGGVWNNAPESFFSILMAF